MSLWILVSCCPVLLWSFTWMLLSTKEFTLVSHFISRTHHTLEFNLTYRTCTQNISIAYTWICRRDWNIKMQSMGSTKCVMVSQCGEAGKSWVTLCKADCETKLWCGLMQSRYKVLSTSTHLAPSPVSSHLQILVCLAMFWLLLFILIWLSWHSSQSINWCCSLLCGNIITWN